MKHYLELLQALTYRDVQVRYKQSIIGIAWAVIQPLALMFVFDLVFGRFLKVDSGGIAYPIFVYSCLLPWTFFSASVTRSMSSIEANSSIIKKVALPRDVFPISAVLSSGVDFLAGSLVFFGMMFYYHTEINVAILWVIPLVLIQIVLSVGIGMLVSSLNAYFRDIKYALPLVIQVWFYASPVVYSVTTVPDRLMGWYRLNPMVGIMSGYRDALIYHKAPGSDLLISIAVSIGVLVLGYLVFKKLEGRFADVI